MAGFTTEATAATVVPGGPLRFHTDNPALADYPEEITSVSCSAGPVGNFTFYDGTEGPVMVTAGHCLYGNPDLLVTGEVYVPRTDGHENVGTVVATDLYTPRTRSVLPEVASMAAGKDYAVVRLDEGVTTSGAAQSRDYQGQPASAPQQLTRLKDYPALKPGEIAVDNFGQKICKDGDVGGRSCGTQLFRTNNSVFSYGLNYDFGDSGGVNFDPVTGEVIGVTSMGIGPLGRAQTADSVFESAYGVSDGYVNKAFRIDKGTEGLDKDIASTAERDAVAQQWLAKNNAPAPAQAPAAAESAPETTTATAPTDASPQTANPAATQTLSNQQTFDAIVDAAHRDAQHYTVTLQQQLAAGDFKGAEASWAEASHLAGQYVEVLPAYGAAALAEGAGSSR